MHSTDEDRHRLPIKHQLITGQSDYFQRIRLKKVDRIDRKDRQIYRIKICQSQAVLLTVSAYTRCPGIWSNANIDNDDAQ